MPLPRLLKKFSRKSLRNRTKSTSSASASSVLEPPPPLPNSAASSPSVPNSSSRYIVSSDSSPTPNGQPNGESSVVAVNGAAYPAPPPPMIPSGHAPPQDDFSKDLAGAWKSATTDPKVSKVDKMLLQPVENGVAVVMEKQTQGAAIISGIKTGLDAAGGMEVIESGMNALKEAVPVLLKALDAAAQLHPSANPLIILDLSQAVWALEQKRRDNDRKILALHMEMKDMMEVLTQLQSVKDSEAVAPDGSTIKGRMQGIVKVTADDIKECANTCDTYSKKKLVVKVLKGPIWEGKLVRFVGIFTKRRGEFEFALSIHTSLGVDAANQALNVVDKTTQEMNAKMDMMMKMFAQFVSPEQKEMAKMVEQRGGAACLDNDKALNELNDFENKSGYSLGSPMHEPRGAKASELEELKEDLHTDPDVAVEANMTVFNRKFEVQKRQIIDELTRAVDRAGDRVIDTLLNAGPHNAILDPDVHAVWKDMGWRGSVKARHFVMALRDHFQEGTHKRDPEEGQGQPAATVDRADEWALQYINIVRLQPISEAFDDDASAGLHTGQSHPEGWHQSMQVYINKITELLSKMFAILPAVLPINKSAANTYLKMIYIAVWTVVASLNRCYVNERLQLKFADYVAAEEARLRGNLETVNYDIDEPATLELITGQGRIDRFLLPVMYLLLERHFQILRVSQTRTLHPDELWDARDTLGYVVDAFIARLEMLQSIFKQQKFDLDQQFKSFANGMYQGANQRNFLWDAKKVHEFEFQEYSYNDSLEPQDLEVEKILNHPVDEESLDFEAYTVPLVEEDVDTSKVVHAVQGMLGLWHGFTYLPATGQPFAGMISMVLKPTAIDGDKQRFTATARANGVNFTVTGEAQASDSPGVVTLSFQRSFRTRFPTQYYTGKWDAATDTLQGTLGPEEDVSTHGHAFIFKRIEPENMCFAPLPPEIAEGKARALWAVCDCGGKRWSWAFFKERRDNRKRFIELYIRGTQFGAPLSQEEWNEWSRVTKTFTTADCRFYHSLAEQKIQATTDHDARCDSCKGPIGGARISCLVCQMKDTFNTVDFCEAPGCLTQRVMRDDMQKAHLPHHDVMKVRRVMHIRQFGKMYRDAKEALKYARTFFATTPANEDGDSKNDSKSVVDSADEEGHASVNVARLSRVPTLAVAIPEANSRRASGNYSLSAVSVARSQAIQVPEALAKGPSCCGCSKPVSQPCWYCVQCAEQSFICWECDMKGNVSFGDHNVHTHDLVRVQELVEEQDLSMEERFTELGSRFSKHEQAFSKHEQAMDERLARLETAVDGRMEKMEKLLEQLLGRLPAT
ncbi:hypothetical protein C8J57DRAFT_1458070 [Mycena rebaudengoi]|nr:hypothetical protein C8J57DRAFT_1458070 [Mycena rebaudengoi]